MLSSINLGHKIVIFYGEEESGFPLVPPKYDPVTVLPSSALSCPSLAFHRYKKSNDVTVLSFYCHCIP